MGSALEAFHRLSEAAEELRLGLQDRKLTSCARHDVFFGKLKDSASLQVVLWIGGFGLAVWIGGLGFELLVLAEGT